MSLNWQDDVKTNQVLMRGECVIAWNQRCYPVDREESGGNSPRQPPPESGNDRTSQRCSPSDRGGTTAKTNIIIIIIVIVQNEFTSVFYVLWCFCFCGGNIVINKFYLLSVLSRFLILKSSLSASPWKKNKKMKNSKGKETINIKFAFFFYRYNRFIAIKMFSPFFL